MENKRYLKAFSSQADYDAQKDEVMGVPHVVLLEDTKEVVYKPLKEEPSDPFNGHEYVDLGLPSGTLWATKAVGAESEEDYGLYFAWGSTEGYTSEEAANDFIFGTSGNEVGSGVPYMADANTPTKYNHEDGKTVLDLEDDAAHVHMGGDWHMPTKEQLEELTANTISTWTTMNGVNGRLFTSKTNGNTLFVPATGNASRGGVYNVGSYGYVWSSSVNEESLSYAWRLYFYSSYVLVSDNSRTSGQVAFGVVG